LLLTVWRQCDRRLDVDTINVACIKDVCSVV